MGDVTVFRCKVCNGLLKEEDINLRNGIASCAYCHAVMRFDELAESPDEGSDEGPIERLPIAMPARFTVEDFGGELRITQRWFSAACFFLAFFCLIWNGFLVFWYGVGLSTGAPLVMLVFPLLHVAVGVGLTYACLAMFVNRTTVTAGSGRLDVAHGPLPWPGGGSYETSELKQLYCEETVQKGKNGPTYSYGLKAVARNGRKLELIKSLQEPDQALFIEQQLEAHLRIEDEPVAGELPR